METDTMSDDGLNCYVLTYNTEAQEEKWLKHFYGAYIGEALRKLIYGWIVEELSNITIIKETE